MPLKKSRVLLLAVSFALCLSLVASACRASDPILATQLTHNTNLSVTPMSSAQPSSQPESSESVQPSSNGESEPTSSEEPESSEASSSQTPVNSAPVVLSKSDIEQATQQKQTAQDREEDPGKNKPQPDVVPELTEPTKPDTDPKPLPPVVPPTSSETPSKAPSEAPSQQPESSEPSSSPSQTPSSEPASSQVPAPIEDGWYYDAQGNRYYYVDGYPQTGWQNIGGRNYLFNSSGVLTSRAGIDVSQWQGPNVNWHAVKEDGIDFVILRAGYRGYGTGKLVIDDTFVQNYRGAKAAGLSVGLYFFSQAINEQEAIDEAAFCLELARTRSITEPIFFDPEYAGGDEGRLYNAHLTKEERTRVDLAFCNAIRRAGYKTGLYTNRDWAWNNRYMDRLAPNLLWYARYTNKELSLAETGVQASYWQYTSQGRVNGISGNVDMNVSF